MEDETNAAPAGAGEAVAIDHATAVERIMAMDHPTEPVPQSEADTTPATPTQADGETRVPEGAEPPKQGDEQAQTDAEKTELQINADAKTRLRDGREVSVGDLKRRFEKADELEAEVNRYRVTLAQFQQKAQQQQQLEQHLPNILQRLQAQMPKAPDISLAETDPIEYTVQRARYEERVKELQTVAAAQQQQAMRVQQAQGQRFQEYLKGEQSRILEKIPDLKDPEKGKAWKADYDKVTAHYGFTPQEADQVYDHRLLLMANDLMQYRAILAQKDEAVGRVSKQPGTTAPVLAPQRRVAQAERTAQNVNEAVSRARKSGSMEDAIAAMSLLE